MPGEIKLRIRWNQAADDFGGILASSLSIRLEMISMNEAGVSPLDVSVVLSSAAFNPDLDCNSCGVFLMRSYKGEDLQYYSRPLRH
jgi:hypothetical protein